MVVAVLHVALNALDMLAATTAFVLLLFHLYPSSFALPIAKALTSAIISLSDLFANIP